jgi:hypothetical protein
VERLEEQLADAERDDARQRIAVIGETRCIEAARKIDDGRRLIEEGCTEL